MTEISVTVYVAAGPQSTSCRHVLEAGDRIYQLDTRPSRSLCRACIDQLGRTYTLVRNPDIH